MCGMQHGMQYHRCQLTGTVILVIRPVQNMWFVVPSGSLHSARLNKCHIAVS